ncbi:MAG: hypothetical protein AAGC54_06875, partial [Cyanobacteria bacterium P01_F01_bin.4]
PNTLATLGDAFDPIAMGSAAMLGTPCKTWSHPDLSFALRELPALFACWQNLKVSNWMWFMYFNLS